MQSNGIEEYATHTGELSRGTYKSTNIGGNFEHQVVVAVKWRVMKKTEK